MAVKELTDGGSDGARLGQSASDLVAFHGAEPAAQVSVATLTTGATMVSIVLWAQALNTLLRNKGLFG